MVISANSNQMIYHEEDCPYAKRISRKHIRHISEQAAVSKGYHPCAWCGGLHGIYIRFRTDPTLFGRAREGLTVSYDRVDRGLCFRTDVGFWKILERGDPQTYRLWHLNHGDFDAKARSKDLMRRSFHRQVDVKSTLNIESIIRYIHNHDKAKKIMDRDWKKLPNRTPKQKKYYKQAAKREQRKQHKRIEELFKKLEKGEI